MSAPLVCLDNFLSWGTLTSSSEDTERPWSNVYDGHGTPPGQFAAAGADDYLHLDLNNKYLDGFESTAAAYAWDDESVGSGNTAARATDQANGGTASLKLDYTAADPANYCRGSRTFTNLRPGTRWTVDLAVLGDGTLEVQVFVYLPELGLYLDPATATWTSTPTTFAARTTATWDTTAEVSFTLPSRATALRRRLKLEIYAYLQDDAVTGAGWVDDVHLRPSVDTVLFHSHDVGPVTLEWRVSDNAWGADSLQATLTPRERAFYHHESSPVDNRYQGIILSGTSHQAEWFGQVAFTQSLAPSESPSWGIETERDWPQIRGNGFAAPLGDVRQDRQTIPWEWSSSAAFEEFVLSVWEQTRGGADPFWFVLMDDEDAVLFCRMERTLSDSRAFLALWRSRGITLSEEPHVRWGGLSS